jgi:GNAT superfamily N-acetyltransferase
MPGMIRGCQASEFEAIHEIINDAAAAYRGVIPADCWHEPYMSFDELRAAIAQGVDFSGFYEGHDLVAVMGLQEVDDVVLIRHAYTRTAQRGRGFGTALLQRLRAGADRPILIGTWRAATWAIRFYEKQGFQLVVPDAAKDGLLRRYWTVPERQSAESVVLTDERWFGVSHHQHA